MSPDGIQRKKPFPSRSINFRKQLGRADILSELKKHDALIAKNKKTPSQVINVVFLKVPTPALSGGRILSEQIISWFSLPEGNYDKAKILVKGYQTGNQLAQGQNVVDSLPWVQVGEVDNSPFTCQLEATGESVIFGVQAVSPDNILATLKEIPTLTTDLSDGTLDPP